MKVEVIRTYDAGIFKAKINEMYADRTIEVGRVETHTEVLKQRQEDVLYYVAFVFYQEVE